MKVSELIQRLSAHNPDAEVMILDSFNGGGVPRDLNLGPITQVITAEDAAETGDCEGRIGETVLVIGYGCY